MKKNNKKFINSLIVDQNEPILHAIEKLEKSHKKILFVTKNNKLIGVIEDSDLRRALIKKKNLKGKIINIANKKPKFIYTHEFTYEKVKRIFLNYNCVAIPIVTKKKQIISIEFNKSFYDKSDNIDELKDAFIMAGGLGKRLRPFTNSTPKPLVKYKKKPILDYIIETLIANKIKTIYISLNYKKNKIINHINRKNYNCKFIFIEEKKIMGTAGSLSFLKNKKFEDIFIINGDLITKFDINSLYKFYKENKLNFCAVTKLLNFQIPYGLVQTKNIFVKSLEEKPTFVRSVLIGAYILNSKCLKYLKKNYKIDMPDLIKIFLNKKLKVGYYPTYEKYSHITSSVDLR